VNTVPLHLREANQFVAKHHRHNLPCVGCKFAIGAAQGGKLVGVAIAGRPVCSRLDDGQTLEILRVATNGTANARLLLNSSLSLAFLDRRNGIEGKIGDEQIPDSAILGENADFESVLQHPDLGIATNVEA
jgi:hypothetical protein